MRKGTGNIFIFPFLFMALFSYAQVGQVTDTVRCGSNPSYSYALYLPSYFDEDWEYHVVFVFDPVSDGRKAVELFQRSAEDFGYIVAGTNNAGNGNWDSVYLAFELTMKDVRERFPIDTNCLYTAGFSRGARIASTMAMIHGNMAGVIGCGAGFSPGYPPNFDIGFDYIGIVGNEDYNYREMMKLDSWLTSFNVNHEILEFDGNHNWPPEKYIHKAMQWMRIRKMKSHYKYRDYYLLADFPGEQQKIIDELLNKSQPYEAYREYQYTVSALKGLKDTEAFVKGMNSLMADEGFKEEVRKRKKISDLETIHLENYRNAFRAYRSFDYEPGVEIKTMKWWKKEIKEANKYMEKGNSIRDSLLGIRLVNYVWHTAYMLYESVLNTDEDILAPIYLEIWSIAKPGDPGPEYLLSRYYLQAGNESDAFRHFENAVDRGFKGWDYFLNDTLMAPLKRSKKFRRLDLEVVTDTLLQE